MYCNVGWNERWTLQNNYIWIILGPMATLLIVRKKKGKLPDKQVLLFLFAGQHVVSYQHCQDFSNQVEGQFDSGGSSTQVSFYNTKSEKIRIFPEIFARLEAWSLKILFF